MGTPPKENPLHFHLGVMPDLRKIVLKQLALLVPKIYLRDSPGDIGEPHDTFLSASPDIILRSVKVPDPFKSFGEGSGTESSAALSEPATKGIDNFVYVRVRDKGSAPAHDVLASVWYALPATLVTPQAWIPVGTTIIPMVPVGDVLTVSPPILWPAAMVPDTGHYCFIATISNPQLPAPTPEQLMAWDAFLDFVRNNLQVSWRNFNVVPASTAGGAMDFAFVSPGAPDRDRAMELEVIATLPRDSQAVLDVPATLLATLREPLAEFEPDRGRTVGRARVDPTGTTRLGEFLFPAGSRSELTLRVELPPGTRPVPHQIAVRQLYQGQEVGRVTWRLMPDPPRNRDRAE